MVLVKSEKSTSTVKKTLWPESASELYRPSGRRLSVKLVSTSADRGCYVVSVTDLYGRILGFLDRTYIYIYIYIYIYRKTEKDYAGNPSNNWKLQTRLLVRKGAPHQHTCNCLKIIKERRIIGRGSQMGL
jgi:hypothetical protein